MDDIPIGVELVESLTLAEFAQRHAVELTRFAYLVAGDRGRAEDIVQDVLLAMHRRFGAVLTVDQPLMYARRAVINAQISWRRRHRLREQLTDQIPDHLAAQSGTPEPDDQVWRAIVGLPGRQRTVMVLRYYLGYSDHDTAALLGCRESSVRSLATRAFAALRPVLRPSPTTEGVRA